MAIETGNDVSILQQKRLCTYIFSKFSIRYVCCSKGAVPHSSGPHMNKIAISHVLLKPRARCTFLSFAGGNKHESTAAWLIVMATTMGGMQSIAYHVNKRCRLLESIPRSPDVAISSNAASTRSTKFN